MAIYSLVIINLFIWVPELYTLYKKNEKMTILSCSYQVAAISGFWKISNGGLEMLIINLLIYSFSLIIYYFLETKHLSKKKL